MNSGQTKKIAIKTESLTKKFGQLVAVSGVNLNIQSGEIYALIGPNGAGKTTLIKMMVGLLSADAGYTSIFGYDISRQPEEAKKFFSYISDNPTAYDYLTGREFLVLTGSLRNMKKQKITEHINELIHLFPIANVFDQPMSEYSRGNKQKVAFLATLLPKPRLIIIDEPIVGLDPDSIKIFADTLKEFAENGGTVFLATHILSFAQTCATQVGVMRAGKIVGEKKIEKNTKLEVVYQLYH